MRTSISVTGLAGGTLGFLAFFLPRLWIGIAYLKGEGKDTDEDFSKFLEFAGVSFLYLLASVAALVFPPVARSLVMLLVAGITQSVAFLLEGHPGVQVSIPLLCLPANILLFLGAITSLRRESPAPR